MQTDSPRLTAAALSIIDGTASDWEAMASLAADDAERGILWRLRDIEAIAADSGSREVPFRAWGSLALLEPIGRGSHGEVFVAWDEPLARLVAVKLLQHPHDADAGDQILREARLLARIKHPNVLTIHGADRFDGRTGLWMELVRGRTLDAEVRADGPFAMRDAGAVGVSLARALQAVHDAGVVHRDVKASNVMREADGRVVLMDFGVGDALGGRSAGSAIAGTPLYLAPELFEGSAPGVSTDLYALGVLIYHLVTGRYPVEGASVVALRAQHRSSVAAPDLSDVPPVLRNVLSRALAPEPGARFASAAAMAEALDHVARPAPRKPFAVVAAALTAAVAVAIGYVAWVTVAPAGESVLQAWNPGWPTGVKLGGPIGEGLVLTCSDNEGRLALCDVSNGTIRPVIDHDPGGVQGGFSVASAGGDRIAYLRTVDERSELHVVSADGSDDRRLYRATDFIGSIRPGGFSPDGREVVGLWRDKAGDDTDYETAIVRIDATTGEWLHQCPIAGGVVEGFAVSPDGAVVAFDIGDPDRNIVIRRLAGCDDQVLGVASADEAHPVWTPEADYLLYVSDEGGTRGLYAQRFAEGQLEGAPQKLKELGRNRLATLGFGHRGRTLLYLETAGGTEVRMGALDEGGRLDGDSRRIASNVVGESKSPRWSPDGRRLAFIEKSGASGSSVDGLTVIVRDVQDDTERIVPVPGSFEQARLRDWSADGQSLEYLWFVPGSGGRTALVDTSSGHVGLGSSLYRGGETVGPNGQSLVRVTSDKTINEIFRLPTPFQFQRPLPQAVVRFQQGHRTALGARDPASGLNVIHVINEVTGESFELPSQVLDLRPLTWSPDGRTLYVARRTRVEPPLYELIGFDDAGSAPGRVVLTIDAVLRSLSLQPFGNQLAYAVDFPESTRLWSDTGFRVR